MLSARRTAAATAGLYDTVSLPPDGPKTRPSAALVTIAQSRSGARSITILGTVRELAGQLVSIEDTPCLTASRSNKREQYGCLRIGHRPLPANPPLRRTPRSGNG
jgi:hypothetical protein